MRLEEITLTSPHATNSLLSIVYMSQKKMFCDFTIIIRAKQYGKIIYHFTSIIITINKLLFNLSSKTDFCSWVNFFVALAQEINILQI